MSSGEERLGKHSVTPSTAVDGLEETSRWFYFTFHSSFKSQYFAKCKIIMICVPHITLCHWDGLESAWQNQRLQLCPEWNYFSACEQWSQSQGIQHQTGEFLPKTYIFFCESMAYIWSFSASSCTWRHFYNHKDRRGFENSRKKKALMLEFSEKAAPVWIFWLTNTHTDSVNSNRGA